MNILFVDPKSSTPYDGEIIRDEAVGGTEATLVTIAEGLATKHQVVVEQLGRSEPFTFSPSLRYLPLRTPHPFGDHPADVVIILRRIRLTTPYRRRFPQAKMYVWLHNWQRPEVVLKRVLLARNHCALITVSDALLQATGRLVNGFPARLIGTCVGAGRRVVIERIYNPIDDKLQVEPVEINRDRMIFCSTANKGLTQVLQAFDAVREAIPSMQLDLAGNSLEVLECHAPGCTQKNGIRLLGRIPRQELLEHVRKSLCVFYPQSNHPETFGLVFAEANAVGTPVMAHDFGSAAEILQDTAQLVNAKNHSTIINRINQWRCGERPKVSGQREFRATAVISRWHQLLS